MYPEIVSEVFKLRNTTRYNLRQTWQVSTDPIHSVYKGTESASYLEQNIWEQVPAEIKNKESLDGIKREKEKWRNPLNAHVEFVGSLYLI